MDNENLVIYTKIMYIISAILPGTIPVVAQERLEIDRQL